MYFQMPTFTWSVSAFAIMGGQGMAALFCFQFLQCKCLIYLPLFNHTQSPCTDGSYDDHDDIIFAVADSSVPAPVTPAPSKKPTTKVGGKSSHLSCSHIIIVSLILLLLQTKPTNPPTIRPSSKPTDSPTKKVSLSVCLYLFVAH
jgi:hypothetical protein